MKKIDLTYHFREDWKELWKKDKIRQDLREKMIRVDDAKIWMVSEMPAQKTRCPNVLKKSVGLRNFLSGLLP